MKISFNKFNEKFKRPLILVTAVPIFLSGCSFNNNSKSQDKEFDKELAKKIYSTDISVDDNKNNDSDITSSIYDFDNKKEYVETIDDDSSPKVKLSENDYDDIMKKIKNVEVTYPYSEIFDVNKAYERYKSMNYYEGTNESLNYSFYINGRIDSNKLYEKIKNNNSKYMNENPYKAYSEFDTNYTKKVCDVLAKTINLALDNNEVDTNLDDLLENLDDLKIFDAHTLVNASVTDDNCLTISQVGIDGMQSITGYDNSFEIIISHEANHLIQKLSTNTRDKQGISRGYGFNVAFDDLRVNSLYLNWLIEASAESLADKQYGVKPMTYKTKISYLNSLSYVMLLDDDFNMYDIEKLTQQQSLDKVFDKFKCTSDNEKIELLKLLESINIIQDDDDEFLQIYASQKFNKTTLTDSELTEMKVELKNAVCTTLTKYFYSNLANYAKNTCKITDIYRLISIFESDLAVHINYSGDGLYDTREYFINNYLDIQDCFFTELANSNYLNKDELLNDYNAYNDSIEIKRETLLSKAEYDYFRISNLDTEKNDFVNKLFVDDINFKVKSIHSVKTKFCK